MSQSVHTSVLVPARIFPGGSMTDEELIEQAQSLPLLYCDGFGAYRKVNGILRCVGFILQGGAVLNLGVSLIGADAAQCDTQRTLHEERPTKSLSIWSDHKMAH